MGGLGGDDLLLVLVLDRVGCRQLLGVLGQEAGPQGLTWVRCVLVSRAGIPVSLLQHMDSSDVSPGSTQCT